MSTGQEIKERLQTQLEAWYKARDNCKGIYKTVEEIKAAQTDRVDAELRLWRTLYRLIDAAEYVEDAGLGPIFDEEV